MVTPPSTDDNALRDAAAPSGSASTVAEVLRAVATDVGDQPARDQHLQTLFGRRIGRQQHAAVSNAARGAAAGAAPSSGCACRRPSWVTTCWTPTIKRDDARDREGTRLRCHRRARACAVADACADAAPLGGSAAAGSPSPAASAEAASVGAAARADLARTCRACPRGASPSSCGLRRKGALGDVLHHAIRHEVPDRLAGRDPCPAVRRADRQRRHLDQASRRPPGSPASERSCPGRVTPTKCASANSSSARCQPRIASSASAPVMKNSSMFSPPYRSRRSCSVSIVYVGPGRSMSTRLTENARVRRGRDDRHQVAVLGGAHRRRASSATAGRWGRRPPRRGRTGSRPHWPPRGARGGPGRRCRP